MARSPRLSLSFYPHHVIQRGNNRQPIFLASRDYEVFLDCLREAKRKCHARLYAYVLMTNHVHLLVEPDHEGDVGRFRQSVGRRYVRYINDVHARTGTLWEGRFKSAIVSRDEYLLACSRYIELNPVRAGMVRHPRDYRWSSYHGRALGRPDPLLDEDPPGASLWGVAHRREQRPMPSGWRSRCLITNGIASGQRRSRGESREVNLFRRKFGIKSEGGW